MASRKIEDLHTDFQGIAQKFIAWASEEIKPWEVFITDGYRSHKEQAELYAKGRTKPGKIVTYAKPGYSWHNFGLALDVAFRQNPGEAFWKVDLYEKIAPIALRLDMIWGGTWTKFKDRPHFEWHPGITLADARAGKQPVKGGEIRPKEPMEEIKNNIINFLRERGYEDHQMEGAVRAWADSHRKLTEEVQPAFEKQKDKIKALKEQVKLVERMKKNDTLEKLLKPESLLNLFSALKKKASDVNTLVKSPEDLWRALRRVRNYVLAFSMIQFAFYVLGPENIKPEFSNLAEFVRDPDTVAVLLAAVVGGVFKYLRTKEVKVLNQVPL